LGCIASMRCCMSVMNSLAEHARQFCTVSCVGEE
jgi:hypothetical protein